MRDQVLVKPISQRQMRSFQPNRGLNCRVLDSQQYPMCHVSRHLHTSRGIFGVGLKFHDGTIGYYHFPKITYIFHVRVNHTFPLNFMVIKAAIL